MGQVINLLEIAGAQQVMLEVKVAEIARTEIKRLQARFNAIGPGTPWTLGGVNGGAKFPDVLFVPDNRRIPVFDGIAPWGPAIDEFAPTDLSIENQGPLRELPQQELPLQHGHRRREGEGPRAHSRRTHAHDAHRPGGEVPVRRRVPIPVPNGFNGVTIEFKEFGVGLKDSCPSC